MSEWLVERGIGETRAALVAGGRIVKARIERDGDGPRVGAIMAARLVERLGPALARTALDQGGEAMLDRPPPVLTLGARLRVETTREAIPERVRPKLAKAVLAAEGALPGPGPSLIDRITATALPVRYPPAHGPDLLEAAGWSEVIAEALTGEIAFPGGALRLFVTPAMTLFDVDGAPPLGPLARAAAGAVGAAIVRHGVGGSIGVDFPTLANKDERLAAAHTLDLALPQPFERTAINGFGFLQIVRRRSRTSLPELIQGDPVAVETLALLRSLERTPPPLSADQPVPPRIAKRLAREPGWVAEARRRTGVALAFRPTAPQLRG